MLIDEQSLTCEHFAQAQSDGDNTDGAMLSQEEPFYILGAGPTGMAAAYSLTKQRQPAIVVERDAAVGGLSKSIDFQGFILDYGPHFFTTDSERIAQFWTRFWGRKK